MCGSLTRRTCPLLLLKVSYTITDLMTLEQMLLRMELERVFSYPALLPLLHMPERFSFYPINCSTLA
jgi:hypothetical protein